MKEATYCCDVSDDAFTPVLGEGRAIPTGSAYTLGDDDLRVLADFFLLRESDGEYLSTRRTDGEVQLLPRTGARRHWSR
jgi:hypothetical protein